MPILPDAARYVKKTSAIIADHQGSPLGRSFSNPMSTR